MKKAIVTLGSTLLLTSLFMAGCEEDTKPAVENQNVEDMDYNSRKELIKDKQKTHDKLKMTDSQKDEFDKSYDKLPKDYQKIVDNMYAEKIKFYFTRNYNEKMNTNADYVVFVKDSDKFNQLYKSTLENFAKANKDRTVEIYTDKGQHIKFDNDNIKVKSSKDAELQFKNDNFVVDEVPSLFVLDNRQIKGNIVGYYDKANLNEYINKIEKAGEHDGK